MGFNGEALTCIRGDRLVFEDLDFDLQPGGCLVLRGPNGSGKSSLLRLCAGFLAPAEGRLRFDGLPIDDDREAHRARLIYVGHLDPLKPVLTVAENLAFWAAMNGASGAAEDALARFGMAGLADLPARYLSAGQRRKVNLARLATSAAVLWLLDEPTTALDDAAVAALTALIAAHRADGGMVMAATHIDLGLPDAAALRLETPRFPVAVDFR